MEFARAFDPFRALQTSWTAVKQAPVPLLLGGMLLAFTGGGGGVGVPIDPSRGGRDVDVEAFLPLLLGAIGFGCCLAIAFFLFSSWIAIGFQRVVLDVLRTGRGDPGTVFDARGRFWDMVLARLFAGLIQLAAFLPFAVVLGGVAWALSERAIDDEVAIAAFVVVGLLAAIVSIYVGLGVSMTAQAVALEDLSPADALRRSWSIARGHRWRLLLYWIVVGLFALLGLCACCIGVLFTAALARIAATESFLALTRGAERPTWWIETGVVAPAGGPERPGDWGAPPPITPPRA